MNHIINKTTVTSDVMIDAAEGLDQDVQHDAAVLKIIKATYGPFDSDHRPEMLRFVTAQVRNQVAKSGGDCLVINEALNGLFGDPCEDETKLLTIYYVARGIPGVYTCLEGSKVLIDARLVEERRLHRSRSSEMGGSFGHSSRYLSRSSSADQDVSPNNVLMMPDMIGAVLQMLPLYPDRLLSAAVCKLWRDVLYENGLTDKVVVGARAYTGSPCYLDMPVQFFEMVLKRSISHLVVLDLGYYESITDSILLPALEGNPTLKELVLDGCVNLSSMVLEQIGKCCPMLTVLSLKRLMNVTDLVVASFARGCRHLEFLNLSDCSNVGDDGIITISNHLRSLRVFHAKDLHEVTNRSIKMFLERASRHLELLSLWSIFGLSANGLEPMSTRVMENLVSLNLWECFELDDFAVTEYVCKCINLVNLNLRNCHLLTDDSVIGISVSLPKLEHLNLRYLHSITDASLLSIAENLHSLRSLNLTHCSSISMNVENPHLGIAQVCRKLNWLTELFLAYNREINDDVIRLIGHAMQERAEHSDTLLDLLDVRDCPNVTDNARSILSEMLHKNFEMRNGVILFSPVFKKNYKQVSK